MRRLSCSLLLSLLACASQPPSPFFGDEQYLVLGVQPDEEAQRLQEQLEAAGHALQLRFGGQHFHALGFADREGRPALVRVVTARGIVVALDPEPGDAIHPSQRFRLVAAPRLDGHDADGDGFEEIFVERMVAGREPCVLVYRARDSGFVDLVAVPEGYALQVAPERADRAFAAGVYCEVAAAPPDAADAGAAAPSERVEEALTVPDAGSRATP